MKTDNRRREKLGIRQIRITEIMEDYKRLILLKAYNKCVAYSIIPLGVACFLIALCILLSVGIFYGMVCVR